jgi:hypothetical protein
METFELKFLRVKVGTKDIDEIFADMGDKKKRVAAAASRGGIQGNNMYIRPKYVATNPVDPKSNGTWFSKVPSSTTNVDYVVTHEWGHLREKVKAFELGQQNEKINEIVDRIGKQYLSEYGKSDAAEAYAESWADWVINKGKTDNPITNAIAREFGWT